MSHTTSLDTDRAHLMHPLHHPSSYKTARIWVSGEGALITDSTGREYIDGLSGLWNVNIGHGRQELGEAARKQMGTLAFHSAYAGGSNEPAIALAERLSGLVYPSINTFFFTSGGAEASETSFKTARFYWKARGKPDKFKVISRQRAYHGLTLAAMSATGLSAFWPMFEPRTPGFLHIDAPDPYRFSSPDPSDQRRRGRCQSTGRSHPARRARHGRGVHRRARAGRRRRDRAAAGLLRPHSRDLHEARRAAHRRRSDHRLRAHRDDGSGWSITASSPTSCSSPRASPAATSRSAASACRIPIREVINGVPPGQRWMHAFTYSGHPTCCAVALANIDILERERLVERAAAAGDRLLRGLRSLESMDGVGNVRGLGLMAAVEIVSDKTTQAAVPARSRPHAEAHRGDARPRALHARGDGLHLPGAAARDHRRRDRSHRQHGRRNHSRGAGGKKS